jgi:serine protease Do
VYLAEMTPEVAEGFGLAGQKGVLISRVMDASPAAKAGLQRNDVIVEFDGQPVSDMVKLRLRVADTSPGKPVSMVVLREGKRVTFTVTPEDKEKKLAANTDDSAVDDGKTSLGGLTVRDLRDEERKQLGIENGVRVTDVQDGSIADDKGIQPNDVIEMVGGSAAKDAVTFARLMTAAKRAGRPAVLYVNRNGNSQYVPMRLDK